MDYEFIIKKLNLKPLEFEGGFYTRTYESKKIIKQQHLPKRYTHDKALSTAIYYFLTKDTMSALHRLKTDEIFHFYLGDPVVMLLIHENKKIEKKVLGNRLDRDELPQIIVPAGTWQGSILIKGGEYALMGTTMSPGFDFTDFEVPDKNELLNNYPQEKELITKLTPPFAE